LQQTIKRLRKKFKASDNEFEMAYRNGTEGLCGRARLENRAQLRWRQGAASYDSLIEAAMRKAAPSKSAA